MGNFSRGSYSQYLLTNSFFASTKHKAGLGEWLEQRLKVRALVDFMLSFKTPDNARRQKLAGNLKSFQPQAAPFSYYSYAPLLVIFSPQIPPPSKHVCSVFNMSSDSSLNSSRFGHAHIAYSEFRIHLAFLTLP